MAFDIFSGHISDEFLSSKFVASRSVRQLRHNRMLEERFYNVDYLIYQPLARLIALVNQFTEFMVNSRSRASFKSEVIVAMSQMQIVE